MSAITQIPLELFLNISAHIDLPQLMQLERVSQAWQILISNKKLWDQQLCFIKGNAFAQEVRQLKNYDPKLLIFFDFQINKKFKLLLSSSKVKMNNWRSRNKMLQVARLALASFEQNIICFYFLDENTYFHQVPQNIHKIFTFTTYSTKEKLNSLIKKISNTLLFSFHFPDQIKLPLRLFSKQRLEEEVIHKKMIEWKKNKCISFFSRVEDYYVINHINDFNPYFICESLSKEEEINDFLFTNWLDSIHSAFSRTGRTMPFSNSFIKEVIENRLKNDKTKMKEYTERWKKHAEEELVTYFKRTFE